MLLIEYEVISTVPPPASHIRTLSPTFKILADPLLAYSRRVAIAAASGSGINRISSPGREANPASLAALIVASLAASLQMAGMLNQNSNGVTRIMSAWSLLVNV